MENKMRPANVLRIMGAFISWIMGSGFATGQEILQFFTSYGYYSFIMIAINLVGFLLIGPAIMEAGFLHRNEEGWIQTEHFCGRKLGTFYTWFISLSMFTGMVILISGAGASLHEYYGVHHYVGALALAAAAFAAYVIGFQRFVKLAAVIGPAIIAFTILVGLITVLRDFGSLDTVNDFPEVMAARQPTRFWGLTAILYISYNLTGGSMYYAAVGASASTRKEAVTGASLGAAAVMVAILLMNTAMLTDLGNTGVVDIPTLFLAKKISFALGAVFSVTLICGIFCTCSAMLWTVSERFVRQGSRASLVFAGSLALFSFLLGLLPFTDLVSIIYPYLGYLDLIFICCVLWTRFFRKDSLRV